MLSSKLCHDLITPIGALNTSFELYSTADAEDQSQLFELAKQSADKAIRKLIFFRAAFGYSTDSHFASVEQTKNLLQNFLRINKIDLIWDQKNSLVESSDLSSKIPIYGQLIANLTFIFSEIAPSGGQVLIAFTEENPQNVHLTLKGKLVPLRPIIINALKGLLPENEASSHVIQAIYTRMLCENLKANLEIVHQERVSLEFFIKFGI